MLQNLQIHALLEKRAQHADPAWSFECSAAPSTQPRNFRIHLDLQMGPIFITIGDKMVNERYSHTHFVKETA